MHCQMCVDNKASDQDPISYGVADGYTSDSLNISTAKAWQ